MASPKPRAMFLVFETSEGATILAVRTLVPTVPTNFKEPKEARPAVALIALVPVRVASATETEMVWVDWAPVVTRFKSSSRISTTTADPKVRSLAAVVAPVRESDAATP